MRRRVERWRDRPIVQPHRLPTVLGRFPAVSGNNVRMEGGLDVPEHLVIQPFGASHLQHRVADASHVVEEVQTRLASERVQIRHDRLR